MRCRYCFLEQHPEFMTLKVAMDSVSFLIHNAEETGTVPGITFFGGEPLLCWESVVVPLTKYIRREYGKPFSLSITSNCVLMTKEKLEFMRENDIGLLFSIDGDEETQNWNRPLSNGEDSFSLLKEKIPLILDYYPEMTFRSTIIPETCKQLFHNIMFAENSGYKNFFVIPNVFEPWGDNAKQTVETEMRKYSEYFIETFRGGTRPIMFGSYGDSFRKIQRINMAISNSDCRNEDVCGACAKCGLGTSSFASIDYSGSIFACQELTSPHGENDKFYIGSIYSGARDDLRDNLSSSFNTKEHGEDCKHCRLNRICDGGCVANNYMGTGDINKMPPVFCWWLNLMLNETIYISTVLGQEKNQIFLDYWVEVHGGGNNG